MGSAATVEATTEAPAATIPLNTKPLLLNPHLLPSHYTNNNEKQQTWASFSIKKDPNFRAYSGDEVLENFFFPATPISQNRAKWRKKLTWDWRRPD